MDDKEEAKIWWQGREKPKLTVGQFAAMTDADLDRFMTEHVCRFYTWQPDGNAIWWEGADGWPTEFTVTRERDEQGRTPFRPVADFKSQELLRKRFEVDGYGRALCWRVLVQEGFTQE